MKKQILRSFFAVLLCAALILCVVACTNDGNDNTNTTGGKGSETKAPTVTQPKETEPSTEPVETEPAETYPEDGPDWSKDY